jgi:hypothetical protein
LSIKHDYYTKYYSGRLSTYRLDRTIVMVGGTEDAGNVYQSTLGGRFLLRLGGHCLLCSNGSRCSALLRSSGHHLFSSGGYGLCAPLRGRGLALQLR